MGDGAQLPSLVVMLHCNLLGQPDILILQEATVQSVS